MRTMLYGKLGIKTIKSKAKITNLGNVFQFDFNLMNEDLRHKISRLMKTASFSTVKKPSDAVTSHLPKSDHNMLQPDQMDFIG